MEQIKLLIEADLANFSKFVKERCNFEEDEDGIGDLHFDEVKYEPKSVEFPLDAVVVSDNKLGFCLILVTEADWAELDNRQSLKWELNEFKYKDVVLRCGEYWF